MSVEVDMVTDRNFMDCEVFDRESWIGGRVIRPAADGTTLVEFRIPMTGRKTRKKFKPGDIRALS